MIIEVFLTSFALSVLNGMSLLVSYINNNKFPHPLSKEEEARCFEILQRRNTFSGADIDAIESLQTEHARNMLIEHNLRLVAYVLKQFGDNEEKNEDLFSIGMIGLIKAIDTFKPRHGAKLSTYAIPCIRNEILMDYRKAKGKSSETSLFKPIGQDDSGDELSMIDRLMADNKPIPDQIIYNEEHRLLHQNVEKLPVRHRQVLQMRYGLRNSLTRSQQEVADRLGISRSYVSRIEKKALELLNHGMKERQP